MVTRTPPFDRLITARGAAGTLYAPDGVSSPVAVAALASNAGGLRSMRESGDITQATFLSTLTPLPTPGQVLNIGEMWYILVKVLRPTVAGMPIQATMDVLTFTLAGTRGATALSLQVVVRADAQTMRPDGTLSEKLTLLCPLGADVRVGDRYTYNGFIYRVDAVSLASADGHAFGQELLCDLVGVSDAVPTSYPVTNSVIAVLRGVYNESTRQTSASAPVAGLEAVPVFIRDINHMLREQGLAPDATLEMLWDPRYDIRDGDQVTGYNPSGSARPAILLVQHAADLADATVFPCRVAQLIAQETAGYST